jgi:hypothetical protein
MLIARPLSNYPPFPLWPTIEESEHGGKTHYFQSPIEQSSLPSTAKVLRVELVPDGELALKVKSRSNTKPTGGLPSMKSNAIVHWASPAEGMLGNMLECAALVTYFGAQPGTVIYTLDGKEERRHFPDMLSRGERQPIIWEVKTEEDAWRQEIALRTTLMVRDLPLHGFIYRIALAEHLRREPRLQNLKQLRRLGRANVPHVAREAARRLFGASPVILWGNFDELRLGDVTPAVVCRLVLEGVLWLDVDKPLSATTQVMTMAHALTTTGHE